MSEIITSYKTIVEPTTSYFRDRGSKFYGFAYPFDDVEDLKVYLDPLKKEHPKAVHHCYAYRIGTDGLVFRANDDGEPSGSAGAPILGQIDSMELTNVLVIIVRYFGGTLLGVPGLINAYRETTALALEEAKIEERIIEHFVQLQFDYPLMNEVMMVIKQHDLRVVHQDLQMDCKIKIAIPLDRKKVVLDKLQSMHQLTLSE